MVNGIIWQEYSTCSQNTDAIEENTVPSGPMWSGWNPTHPHEPFPQVSKHTGQSGHAGEDHVPSGENAVPPSENLVMSDEITVTSGEKAIQYLHK
jgi:hypothetical protein